MSERQLVVAEETVDALMARYPATMSIFNAFGVDTCCGAHRTVREAAAEDGTDESKLVSALQLAIVESR